MVLYGIFYHTAENKPLSRLKRQYLKRNFEYVSVTMGSLCWKSPPGYADLADL